MHIDEDMTKLVESSKLKVKLLEAKDEAIETYDVKTRLFDKTKVLEARGIQQANL